MTLISKKDISVTLNYKELVSALEIAFGSEEFAVPSRQHLDLPHGNLSLVMPAWNQNFYGLKQILACPDNPSNGLPLIQGKYDLFDVKNGSYLVSIDAAKLTAVRTAATSVLAASFFVRHPKKLVILGNGVIANHLKEAYNAVYDLEKTVIWSRSLAAQIDLEKELRNADIISCATHAYEPILKGKWITGKPHIDLVGSYKPTMREADDDLISRCEIYIDDIPALAEAGDLVIPLDAGVINSSDVKGTLFDLCKKEIKPLKTNQATLFKSVGHAIEDLATAIYLYEKIVSNK